MINFLLSFLIVIPTFSSNNKSFKGSIKLAQETYYDTTYFTYYVKIPQIRIDKFDSNHKLEQSILVNLNSKQVYMVSNTKKMYTSPQTKENEINSIDENFIVLKTENSRMIGDYLCYQWRVKNKERNTEVTYWVTQNNFYFFNALLKIIGNIDKTYEFFAQIPESEGFFPVLSVERTILRKQKSKTYVVDIEKKDIAEDLFTIPSNFKLVMR